MKTQHWFSFFVLFFLFAGKAVAVADPVTVNLLTQQLASIKLLLDEAKKNLAEAKIASSGVLEVRDTIHEVKKEYETLINTDLRNELLYIREKYAALTNLDDLQDATTFQEKYALLHEEIGLRFKEDTALTRGSTDPTQALKKKPLSLENNIQTTLIQLNEVEIELARYRQTQQQAGTKQLGDKDLQKLIMESSAATAALLLEQKKLKLEQERLRQEQFQAEMVWNNLFLHYLADQKGGIDGVDRTSGSHSDAIADLDILSNPKGNVGAIDSNWLTRFFVNILNPEFVYKGMALLSSIPTLFLWLVVLFGSFRLYQEGVASVSGKASIGKALQSMGGMVTMYIIYFSSGFFVFSLIFAYFSLFEGIGSVDYIHSNLLDLRAVLIEKKVYSSWLTEASQNVLDYLNIISASATWAIYQAVSIVYVIASQLIDILFALLVAFLWAFGFIAITTSVLKGRFNLVNVWAVSVYGVFLWGIIELILMALLAGFNYYSATWLVQNYAGLGQGYTAVTLWHLYSVIQMVLILILKLLAIWFSFQFTQHQSVTGAVAGAASIVTMFIASKTIPDVDSLKGAAAGMTPDASGERKRDGIGRLGETVSNAMTSPISDVARAGVTGAKDIGSTLKDIFVPANKSGKE